MTIFNVTGKMVLQLVDQRQSAGMHAVVWDGLDSFGKPVASGVYYCQMRMDGLSRVRKMVLAK